MGRLGVAVSRKIKILKNNSVAKELILPNSLMCNTRYMQIQLLFCYKWNVSILFIHEKKHSFPGVAQKRKQNNLCSITTSRANLKDFIPPRQCGTCPNLWSLCRTLHLGQQSRQLRCQTLQRPCDLLPGLCSTSSYRTWCGVSCTSPSCSWWRRLELAPSIWQIATCFL